MKVTNKLDPKTYGPRGINTVGGAVLVNPGETIEVDVYEREKAHIEASGWFDVTGSYTANPDGQIIQGLTVLDNSAEDALKAKDKEIEELKRLLAEKNGGGSPDAMKPADLLAKAESLHFQTFKAEARKILGDATPETKDDIVAALKAKTQA